MKKRERKKVILFYLFIFIYFKLATDSFNIICNHNQSMITNNIKTFKIKNLKLY